MSNVISKYYRFPQTETYKGVPVSPSTSDSDSENEPYLPILSHIVGTQKIFTVETDSD